MQARVELSGDSLGKNLLDSYEEVTSIADVVITRVNVADRDRKAPDVKGNQKKDRRAEPTNIASDPSRPEHCRNLQVGVFLLIAVRNSSAHRSLIAFAAGQASLTR